MKLKPIRDIARRPAANARVFSEDNRVRAEKPHKDLTKVNVRDVLSFTNPFPNESDAEAMVQLELLKRHIPFSYRYFDGIAPNFQQLMPGYEPEFTLSEYHIVILVIGSFFGTIPTILDKTSLAQVLLEADGWKVAQLQEVDIKQDVSGLLDKTFPELVNPAITGPQHNNPYGTPDFMTKRRIQLRGQALAKKKFRLDQTEQRAQGGPATDDGRKRLRRRRRNNDAIRSIARGT